MQCCVLCGQWAGGQGHRAGESLGYEPLCRLSKPAGFAPRPMLQRVQHPSLTPSPPLIDPHPSLPSLDRPSSLAIEITYLSCVRVQVQVHQRKTLHEGIQLHHRCECRVCSAVFELCILRVLHVQCVPCCVRTVFALCVLACAACAVCSVLMVVCVSLWGGGADLHQAGDGQVPSSIHRVEVQGPCSFSAEVEGPLGEGHELA